MRNLPWVVYAVLVVFGAYVPGVEAEGLIPISADSFLVNSG